MYSHAVVRVRRYRSFHIPAVVFIPAGMISVLILVEGYFIKYSGYLIIAYERYKIILYFMRSIKVLVVKTPPFYVKVRMMRGLLGTWYNAKYFIIAWFANKTTILRTNYVYRHS